MSLGDDQGKSKEQLIQELEGLRGQLSEAEESRQILEAIMENAPDAIIVASGTPDFSVRMISRHGHELTGRPREVTDGLQAKEYIRALGLSTANRADSTKLENLPIYKAIKHGKVTDNEEWVLDRPNGRKIPVLCKAAPIRSATGNIIGGITVWRDISELKEAEKLSKDYGSYLEYLVVERTAELAQARETAEQKEIEFSATVNAISSGVMIFDRDGDLSRINKAARDALSYTSEDQLLPFGEWLKGLRITSPDGEEVSIEDFPLSLALRGESISDRKLWIHPKVNGAIKCLSFSAFPIRLSADEQIGVILTFTDITGRQRSEDAWRKALDELETRVLGLKAEREQFLREVEEFKTGRGCSGVGGFLMRTGRAVSRLEAYCRGLLGRAFNTR
jgi:PAS domain S-box-containing protein